MKIYEHRERPVAVGRKHARERMSPPVPGMIWCVLAPTGGGIGLATAAVCAVTDSAVISSTAFFRVSAFA
ncbi:MAG TPA: hypothetical protein VM943_03090 [Pyrinomonadaceae bacterium]|nr:hypothetical protein [Pyrinomonadaceae bacterium]